jgi:hypothetical protein
MARSVKAKKACSRRDQAAYRAALLEGRKVADLEQRLMDLALAVKAFVEAQMVLRRG